jgi:hypothetical protein
MVAGVAEIKERGIVVPTNLGAFVVGEAEADASPETSPSLGTSSSQEEPLVNPLLKPGAFQPSVFGDGRVVVIHAGRNLKVDDELVNLKGQSFSVLAILAVNADRLVGSRVMWQCLSSQPEQEKIKNPEGAQSSYVSRARKALGRDDLGHPETGVLINSHGRGWMAVTTRQGQN